MNKLVTSLFVVTLACGANAIAADTAQGNKAQSTRMSECSADAKTKGLKGDARKEYMSQCLRSPASQAAAKACDADATEKGLKGAKRKDFVKDCIKSKGAGNVG